MNSEYVLSKRRGFNTSLRPVDTREGNEIPLPAALPGRSEAPGKATLNTYVVVRADRIPEPRAHLLLARLGRRSLLERCLDVARKLVGGENAILVCHPWIKIHEDMSSRVAHVLETGRDGREKTGISFREIFHEPGKEVLRIEMDPCFPFLTEEDIHEGLSLWYKRPGTTLVSASRSKWSIWHYHRMDDLRPVRLMGDDPERPYQGFRQFDKTVYKINNALRITNCEQTDNIIYPDRRENGNLSLYILNDLSATFVCSFCDLIYARALLDYKKGKR